MKRIATFAERLLEYRKEKNLTLFELEQKTGIPNQTLSRYELGQIVPKIDVATDIALHLNVSPMWLQGYDVSKELLINDETETNDYDNVLEYYRSRPEMQLLFSASKTATKEDIINAVKFLDALRK